MTYSVYQDNEGPVLLENNLAHGPQRLSEAPPLSDEVIDILGEAIAYRFVFFSVSPNPGEGDSFNLTILANASTSSRMIWGEHTLGTGTWDEITQLRESVTAKYRRLTEETERNANL